MGQLPLDISDEYIGQFTGMLDCDGHKIFEGDIVRYFETKGDREGRIDFFGIVKYHRSSFLISPIEQGTRAWYGFLPIEPNSGESIKIMIAGNVYEDKELLK
jgi:uncharacterized phage protein (TIGR01671 family)